MSEEDVNVRFEKEEKPPEEELLKEQKKQTLEKMEQEEMEEEMEEEPEEMEEKEEVKEKRAVTGFLTDTLIMLWNKIAVGKGYEPITENEADYLKEHTRRFEEKYLNRIAFIQSPEGEAISSWISVLAPKWYKKNMPDLLKPSNANAVPIQKEIKQEGGK